MSVTFGLAIFFVLWWLVLFVVLPLGVETQSDANDIVPGTADSAPVIPRIGRKMLVTTIIAIAIFGTGYALGVSGVVDYDALLFGRER